MVNGRSMSVELPELDAWEAGNEEAEKTLRSVGLVLIIYGIGAIIQDCLNLIRAIQTHQGIGFGVELLASVAGFFLYRGAAWPVRGVAYAAGVSAGGSTIVCLMLPFVMPLDFLVLQIEREPVEYLIGLLLIPISFWVFNRLTTPAVDAFVTSQLGPVKRFWKNPRLGMAVGGIIAAVALSSSAVLLNPNAPDNQRVVAQARKQYGPDYKYFVSGYQGDRYTVTLYNRRETRTVTITLH